MSNQTTGELILDFHSERHGSFRITTTMLDWAIGYYLPSSLLRLHSLIMDDCGIDYSDMQTVTECLAVLADMNAPAYMERPYSQHCQPR